MILIVEDDAAIGAALERALRYLGHDALSVPSALEALSLLHIRCPRLLILDMNLPDMDGLELMRALRREPACEQVPVIFYTSDFSIDRQRQAQAARAAHYIIKGTISMETLLARVQDLLRDSRPPVRFLR